MPRPGNALIPFGGSSPTGALGYVDAGLELREQVPDLDTVVVALGSGGTMAGLVAELGARAVLGVHTGAVADPAATVRTLLADIPGTTAPEHTGALRIRLDQVGEDYARQTDAVAEAMLLAACTEGIVLDPVYTGRALAGLAAAVTEGSLHPGTRTVFPHTGGLPGLFGHPEAVARASVETDRRSGIVLPSPSTE